MPAADDTDTAATASTHDLILDAAIESVSLFGLAKMSMSDVATRAGISRPTLYKHFGSKDALVAGTVEREAVGLVAEVLDAAEAHDDAEPSLEAAVVAALRLTREHPLLDRIIRTEPESLLPYLTTDGLTVDDRAAAGGGGGGAAVLLFVRSATEQLVAAKAPGLDAVTARRLADMVARLLVSYAISAPDDPPEVVARAMSAILLHGAVALAARPDPTGSATRPATGSATHPTAHPTATESPERSHR